MADNEWFCVETSGGTQLAKPGELPPVTRFPNREDAVDVARKAAQQYDDTLTVVKYSRKEIRTFKKKVTVDEADVPS
jgi:hypothetical protein